MSVVGPVAVIVCGFDAQGPLPPEFLQQLTRLRGRGIIRILDVLVVSKDARGAFRAGGGMELDAASGLDGSTLWPLLVFDDVGSDEPPPHAPPAHYPSWEVGLDLDAVEGLAHLIESDTSALLMLVEHKWTTDLLDAVRMSGGFPIVEGCLERETMLVIGPGLASAVAAADAAEHASATRGAAMLHVLANGDPESTIGTNVIPALVDAGLLSDSDVDEAVGALAAAGIVPLALVERAREQADAAVAGIAQIGTRRDRA